MKRILTTFSVLATMFFAKAQTEETTTTTTVTTTTTTVQNNGERRNDVMVNPIALVLGLVNVSYEHHLNKDSGIGVTTALILDDYVVGEDASYFHILPHYRYYFGKKWARGFFLEGFTGITSRKYDDIIGWYTSPDGWGVYPRTEKKRETNFTMGVGFGGKWDLKGNVLLEASVGIGRAFGSDYEPTIAKGMLGIGYRF
ncbi:DUF3575 domain-containing protein [Bergeyella porcorum]|uniref:DUF3575 domain-containing protein n=1 Tax=Bergeyella porcorum TaxID=1735111 RepID=UPI0035E7E03E